MTSVLATAECLLDANVLVAAIRHLPRRTASLRLVAAVLDDPAVRLVANRFLVDEWRRYARRFASTEADALFERFLVRARVVEVPESTYAAALAYFRPSAFVDALHAAICLETGAVLISNDKDFRAIADAGLIRVMTAGQALRWLGLA